MAVRLKSPFTGVKGDKCFGCSRTNPHGLHLEFFEEGDDVLCRWKPDPKFQSWDGVLHGGITATILDETAGWTAMRRFQRTAMTTRLDVRYLKPALVNSGLIVARARYLKQVNEKIARFIATLENDAGVVLAEADADYYIMNEERSRAMGFTECAAETGAEVSRGLSDIAAGRKRSLKPKNDSLSHKEHKREVEKK